MKITFFDNSTALKTIHDLETGARGGMISSLFAVSGGLSLLGHDVSVLSDIENTGTTNTNVYWGALEEVADHTCDVLVCNRSTTDDGLCGIRAKHRVLWTHDLPHSGFIPKPKVINAFDRVVFMSKYAESVWRTFYPLIRKSEYIPNGVDKSIFYPREKDHDYIIYGSAPNRGLQYLNLILTALKNRVRPSLYLKAFSNLQILHPKETTNREINMIENYNWTKADDVQLFDPLPQNQWADELGKAGIMIMPTSYPEICSNVILQSLASGTPIVTTGNLGSVPEWVISGRNGVLTNYLPNDYMVHTIEIVRGARDVLTNRKVHDRMIRHTANTRNIWSWEDVIFKWDKMLCGL